MLLVIADRDMRKHMQFPTRTRFGWLGLLVLAAVFAALKHVVFAHNDILSLTMSSLGMAVTFAFMFEFIDRFGHLSFGEENDNLTNVEPSVTGNTSILWQAVSIAFTSGTLITLLFILWAAFL